MGNKLGILIALMGAILTSINCHKTFWKPDEMVMETISPSMFVKDDLEGAVLIGPINEETVAIAGMKIDSLIQRGAKTLTLKIDSDGGGCEEGNVLIGYIEEKIKNGLKTRCIVDYRARSMAFVILQSGACQERLATKRAMFLAHEPSVSLEGANRRKLHEAIEFLDALSANMAQIAGSRLNIGVDKYKEKIAGGDWSFSYDEALAIGAIDGEIAPDKVPYAYAPIVTAPND